ncbi:hypothetical protein S245_037495 [Arachis hypogaea]|nr:Protein QUIRKY [Arachis hypogaea]
MTTPLNLQQQQHQQLQQAARTVRRVVVEVVDARNLLPKDGQGSSSPYVVADFDGQRKRTTTRFKELNPVWNEPMEFIVSDPENMEFEELEVEVYNDRKFGNASGKKNHFLGRVKLYGTQFARRGEEGLVYFTLEKKSVFSWVRGEIGLKIYYYDELLPEDDRPPQVPPPEEGGPPPEQEQERGRPHGVTIVEEGRVFEGPGTMEPPQMHPHCMPFPEPQPHSPRVVVVESPPPVVHVHHDLPPGTEIGGGGAGAGGPPEMMQYP